MCFVHQISFHVRMAGIMERTIRLDEADNPREYVSGHVQDKFMSSFKNAFLQGKSTEFL